MLTNLKRIFKFAFTDIWRNKGISVAAIFVLTITILLVTGLFILHGMANYIVSEVQNRIDITAYFKDGVSEQNILDVKSQLLQLNSDIKKIEYVSKDDALSNFKQKYQDNAVFSKALDQVGGNPLLPSLNIITSGDPAQYAKIAGVLQGDQFGQIVDSVDFSQKKSTIEKVFSITSDINRFGLISAIISTLIAILVVFNTIKLAINNSKEEINTMKIVGAEGWFIKLPFVVQGAIFGIVSSVICFILFFAFCYFVSPGLSVIMPGFNLFKFFISNIPIIVLIQLGFGMGLGTISSLVVVRTHLEV